MEWRPDICLYHKGCEDGFAAAWAVYRRWGAESVEYIPMGYDSPLPDIAGKHVLMVDCSLKRSAMLEAAQSAASIVVLDHHQTAQAELEMWTLPMAPALITFTEEVLEDIRVRRPHEVIVAIFDMEKSGARLAWEFCHPDKPMPRLLEHVEDRDLWRFKLEWTKEISACLRSMEHSFALFDRFTDDQRLTPLYQEGVGILRAQRKLVGELIGNAYMAEVAGHTVPVLNVPYQYASDCGHELLKRYPDAPFAATWCRGRDRKIVWSLRSEDSREDVSVIAARYGGGGHRNASGFTVRVDPPLLHVDAKGNTHEVAP